MPGIAPYVRHMLLCEDAHESSPGSNKLHIFGLLTRIRVPRDNQPPFSHTFSVFLLMTGGRGKGKGEIQIVHADSGTTVYDSNPVLFQFRNDPLAITASIIRIPDCKFPERGEFSVKFSYNGEVMARESLRVE